MCVLIDVPSIPGCYLLERDTKLALVVGELRFHWAQQHGFGIGNDSTSCVLRLTAPGNQQFDECDGAEHKIADAHDEAPEHGQVQPSRGSGFDEDLAQNSDREVGHGDEHRRESPFQAVTASDSADEPQPGFGVGEEGPDDGDGSEDDADHGAGLS